MEKTVLNLYTGMLVSSFVMVVGIFTLNHLVWLTGLVGLWIMDKGVFYLAEIEVANDNQNNIVRNTNNNSSNESEDSSVDE